MKRFFLSFAFLCQAASAVTPGWENVSPSRADISPAKKLWYATSAGQDFTVEKLHGAEGTVSFADGRIAVEKTNDKGIIVVVARPFAAETNQNLRLSAEVSVESGDYFYAQAFLRAYGKKRDLLPCWKLNTRYFSMGGAEEMCAAVNSAPGMFYRKYTHFIAKEGLVTPVIVVGGAPSRTVWRDWIAEDLDAADAKWEGYFEAKSPADRSAERIPDEELDRILAADRDHTACLKRIDGVTRLVVDGKPEVARAYRAKGAMGKDVMRETFAGAPLIGRARVKLVVRPVPMGGGGTALARRLYWTERGYDVKSAALEIRNMLRLAPDALVILGLSCNAYPEFTTKEHPGEVWRLADGKVVKGTTGSCEVGYDDMGVKDTNRWPWVSYASPAWRNAVKANIAALLGELKRQGIAKRIVGVHLSGYHDGQFYSPFEDHSWCAKAEYERYLAEKPSPVMEFAAFSKTLGFRAQEDFARAFKRELGKDALAIRWCMGPFSGAKDLTAFAHSDVLDICIPQPGYEIRRPGMATEAKLPFSSFNLHGKMYWNEFDLRTYGALESWAASGVVATKGLGQSDDFAMWQTVYRKHAGVMLARNCGYWFYDMGGGWFSPYEITDDIAAVGRVESRLIGAGDSGWRPGVALIADEEGVPTVRRPYVVNILRRQLMLFAASGVPYDFYLAEDVLRNPSLVKGYRMLCFAHFRSFDRRRERLVKEVAGDGRTLVFLAEAGVDGGGKATGFDVDFTETKLSHSIIPTECSAEDCRPMMEGEARRHFPEGPLSVPKGPRCTVKEVAGVKVLARFASDGAPALARLDGEDCVRVYVCEPAGLTPSFFRKLAAGSGAYVPVEKDGVQVDMNGSFVSVHALRTEKWSFRLPFRCKVENVRSGRMEHVENGAFTLDLTAGETAWFILHRD